MNKRHSKKFIVSSLTLILCMLLPSAGLQSQSSSPDFLKHFSWREIGPANPGGRITDIEGVESNPYVIYAGAATGGIWKTENAGTTWEPIFNDQPNASIGDIAISLSNPNILFVGTGEPNNRNSSPWGAGVFKSTDAGKTWEFVGLKETNHIGRVLIDSKNPDIVYVAALGHLWGANDERGVFKTIDGGKTWDKVLFLDEKTGVTDLAMDPENTSIFVAGSNIDNIYFSVDTGLTWERKVVESSFGVWGDPCVVNGVDGEFYFFHLSNQPEGDWIDRIVC